ncbi:hypothetical protein [Euzebya sp.]|uniref:hypothetical protein n=1 Tax=Euzebya sp. TaxID=1971409 RepID=UPI003514E53C
MEHPGRPDPQERPLVDFRDVPGRLQTSAGALAALAVLGCVVDGALNGLTFALMGRWAAMFAAAMLLATAVITALHALGGAGTADRRGERLSAPDVGIRPRRLARVEDPVAEDAAAGDDDGSSGEGEG